MDLKLLLSTYNQRIKDLDCSKKEFAEAVGISYVSLQNLLSGKHGSFEGIRKLEEILLLMEKEKKKEEMPYSERIVNLGITQVYVASLLKMSRQDFSRKINTKKFNKKNFVELDKILEELENARN